MKRRMSRFMSILTAVVMVAAHVATSQDHSASKTPLLQDKLGSFPHRIAASGRHAGAACPNVWLCDPGPPPVYSEYCGGCPTDYDWDEPVPISHWAVGVIAVASPCSITNPCITPVKGSPYSTGGQGLAGGFYASILQVARKVGSDKCAFVSDAGTSDIAAFNNAKKVGNYSNSAFNSSSSGMSLAVPRTGTMLYAAYADSSNIGVWSIGAGCKLTLANAVATPAAVDGMAVTRDGTTLVVAYGGNGNVDSFAISGANLTEKGPYLAIGAPTGVVITKDSKWAIFGDAARSTTVEVFAISKSALSLDTVYSNLGNGFDSQTLTLSQDEKNLFVGNIEGGTITSVNFDESKLPNPGAMSLNCVTKTLKGKPIIGGVAFGSEKSKGTGTIKFLVVAEPGVSSGKPGIGLMTVRSNGCPVESSHSPTPSKGNPLSVSTYPF